MSEQSISSTQPRESAAVSCRADVLFLTALLAYFAALLIGRTLFGGGSLNWDDAEMPVAADLFRPGYGPQLPLYHWFQNLLFDLFGISVFSISLGRDLVRFLTAAIVYGLARQAVRPLPAFVATLALELNIHFAWYAQRAFTHNNSSILFGMLAVLTFWIATRNPQSWRHWFVFGVTCGLGLLSKYNFIFVPVALVIAALFRPEMRMVLMPSRLAAALALALVMVAFPYKWIFDNLALATGASGSLQIADASFIVTRLAGFRELGASIATNAGPAFALALALWRFTRRPVSRPGATERAEEERSNRLGRFLLTYMCVFVVLLAAGVLIAGVGNVRDRWLLPVLSLAGPTAVLLVWHRISGPGRGILAAICSIVAAAVLIGHPLESRLWGDRGNAPFGPVVTAMDEAGATEGTYVIAPFQWVAGNLKHRRPGWIVDDYRQLRLADHSGMPFLLVSENIDSEMRDWSDRTGQQYFACPDRPGRHIDTARLEPDRRRIDLSIQWMCPMGSSSRDE